MLFAAAILIASPPWAAPCAAQEAAPAAANRLASGGEADAASRPVKPRSDAELRKVGQARPNDGAVGWLRTLGALAAVVGLIFGARWALRRWSPAPTGPKKGGPITVVARTGVGGRQQLVLLRLGRRLLLIGNGPSGMTTLAQVTDADEVAELMDEIATRK
jgi:flagellar biogenesis protein FliO